MKRIATVTHTRPSVDVPFFKTPPELEPDWNALFKSGALLSKTMTVTPTQAVYVNVWRSKEDADAFGRSELSRARHQQVDAYNVANGITKTLVFSNAAD